MPHTDARIDAYIARAADFARPILTHIRAVVHSACPEVEETMKWRNPHFQYKGMLCGMAAFKAHVAFGFWKGSLIIEGNRDAMGHFGRITSIDDLPSRSVLAGYVRKAMKLNEQGITSPRLKRTPKPPARVPADLAAALRTNRTAAAAFEGLSPSHRREYIEWITEAKTDATRQRRLATALEWIAEGKSRNWKYM